MKEKLREQEMRRKERDRVSSPAEMCSFMSYAALSLNDTGRLQHPLRESLYIYIPSSYMPSALPHSEEAVFHSVDHFNKSIRGRCVKHCKIQAFSSLTR